MASTFVNLLFIYYLICPQYWLALNSLEFFDYSCLFSFKEEKTHFPKTSVIVAMVTVNYTDQSFYPGKIYWHTIAGNMRGVNILPGTDWLVSLTANPVDSAKKHNSLLVHCLFNQTWCRHILLLVRLSLWTWTWPRQESIFNVCLHVALPKPNTRYGEGGQGKWVRKLLATACN